MSDTLDEDKPAFLAEKPECCLPVIGSSAGARRAEGAYCNRDMRLGAIDLIEELCCLASA